MGRNRYSPAPCTALELLEYMVLRKEEGPFTLYHLMNYAVRSHQRRDRMRKILEFMVRAGWVSVVPPRRYMVTAKGEEVYWKTEELREFFRAMRLGEEEPFCRGNSFPPSLNTVDNPPSNKKEVRGNEGGH